MSALLQPFYEIQKSCGNILNTLKPHLEEENSKIKKFFTDPNSHKIDSTTQDTILNAMILEKRISVLELIIGSINDLEKSKDNFDNNSMKSIESIIWILQKLKSTENMLSKLRAAIEKNCDSKELLMRIWNFEDIDTEKLEKYFLVQFSKPVISEYIISQLLPQEDFREKIEEKLSIIKTDQMIQIESLEDNQNGAQMKQHEKTEENKIDTERGVSVVKEPDEVKPIKMILKSKGSIKKVWTCIKRLRKS